MDEIQFEKFIQERNTVFDMTVQICTTGAMLSPLKVTDSEGKVYWVWYVTEFTGDCFQDGNIFNPIEIAESRNNLLEDNI